MSRSARDDLAGGKTRQAAGADTVSASDLAAVVARFETPLLRYAGQILGPGAGAEDVVQESFLRLHRQVAAHGEDSVGSVAAWLFRVAHNLAINAGKRETQRREVEDEGQKAEGGRQKADDPVDALEALERRASAARAMDELQNLPDEQRRVLLLKIIHGLTLREIGEATGLTPGNVDYKLHQGLRELARRLKAGGVI